MSVSSVSSSSAPLPFNYLDTNAQSTPAAATSDSSSSSNGASDANDAGAAQPPAPPPLPPGQGQRVNQLV
jgi:hypothetical protein